MGASSHTFTLTSSAVAPRHGKLVSHFSPEAMDVTRDGQHPSSGDRPHQTDSMDTSWGGVNKGVGQVRIPGLLLGDQEATTEQPPAPPVLERPREESSGGDTQDAASQLGKTTPTEGPLLFSRSGLTKS